MQQKANNNGDGDNDGISGGNGGNGGSSSSGGSAREMGVVDLWMAFALSAAPRMRSKVTLWTSSSSLHSRFVFSFSSYI